MATYTSKLGLKKPADTDYVDVADINGNMDTLDGAFARFAVCSTAAATAAKTATISGFKLFGSRSVHQILSQEHSSQSDAEYIRHRCESDPVSRCCDLIVLSQRQPHVCVCV